MDTTTPVKEQYSQLETILHDHKKEIFAALDDPLIPRETFPTSASLRHNLTARFSTTGGHLGFCQVREGKLWPSWLDNVIDFLWG